MNDFNDEVKQAILNNMQDDCYDDNATFDDLFNDTCNTEQYCDRRKAEYELSNFNDPENNDCGTFAALRFVKNWEDDNGIENNINEIIDPEKVVDEIYYIKGENFLENALSKNGLDMDSPMTEGNVKAVREALED